MNEYLLHIDKARIDGCQLPKIGIHDTEYVEICGTESNEDGKRVWVKFLYHPFYQDDVFCVKLDHLTLDGQPVTSMTKGNKNAAKG